MTCTYYVGNPCGFTHILEALTKDFIGYGTIPPFLIDGKLPTNKPSPPHVMGVIVTCTICKRSFPFCATHTGSDRWSEQPCVRDTYNPVEKSHLMGNTGKFQGLGYVDCLGNDKIPTSYCNPRFNGGCGNRACLTVKVTLHPFQRLLNQM